MKTYMYRILNSYELLNIAKDYEESLNILGKESWKLVQIDSNEIHIFIREISIFQMDKDGVIRKI